MTSSSNVLAGNSSATGAKASRALAGVGTLFHVAADYRLWAPDPEEIVRNNLNSTGTVMRAAQAAGVGRIVYTSLLRADTSPSATSSSGL